MVQFRGPWCKLALNRKPSIMRTILKLKLYRCMVIKCDHIRPTQCIGSQVSSHMQMHKSIWQKPNGFLFHSTLKCYQYRPHNKTILGFSLGVGSTCQIQLLLYQ